ncbi:hypothetical protein [Chryseobacterium sp. MMO-127]
MTETGSIQGFTDEFSGRISFEIPKTLQHEIIIKLFISSAIHFIKANIP